MTTNIQDAMDRIQAAQKELMQAAQLLSPVDGYAAEWQALKDVHEAVRRTWYAIERRLVELAQERPLTVALQRLMQAQDRETRARIYAEYPIDDLCKIADDADTRPVSDDAAALLTIRNEIAEILELAE